MAGISRLLRLTWRERGLLAAALVLLPLAAGLLRVAGFARLRAGAVAPPRQPGAPARSGDAARVRATVRMVAAAGHHGLYQATCLPQSLVLQWLLRAQGIQTELQLGVRKDGGALGAHAWVEYRGQPLLETADVHQRFAAFEPARSAPRAATRGVP